MRILPVRGQHGSKKRSGPTRGVSVCACSPRPQGAVCPEAARLRGDDGTALAEFALLLPFLAILAFGTADLARAFQFQNRLENMAREGAAYAQFFPARVTSTGACVDPNNIPARARAEEPDLANRPEADIDVVVERLPGGTGTPVVVTGCDAVAFSRSANDSVRTTVSGDFQILTPLVQAFTGDEVRMDAASEVVVQG